jgi:DnaJ-class molecular chaperone
MADPKGYYKILGLTPNASIDDVKRAYRKLAITVHPDKIDNIHGKEKAKEIFVKISEAYQTLSDETKKRNYDRYGLKGVHESFFGNSDDIFNYFDNMFRDSMKIFKKFDEMHEKIIDEMKNGKSKYKSVQKFIETKYVDGKRKTIIKEIINDNGVIREKTTIDDNGQIKDNVKTIDSGKNKEVLKIKEKKRPNF